MHLETQVLVDDALAMQEQGFKGSKIKIGSDHISKDAARLDAVRSAVGSGYEIMTDGNQGFSLSESIRWSRMLQDYSVGWFEEPLPADDIGSHVELSRHSDVPVAVGESLYSVSQFKDYLQQGAASIVQVDVARIGGNYALAESCAYGRGSQYSGLSTLPDGTASFAGLCCAQCQMAGIHSTARHDYEPINEDEGRIRDAFGNTGIGY